MQLLSGRVNMVLLFLNQLNNKYMINNNNQICIGDYVMTQDEYKEYCESYNNYLDNFFKAIEKPIMNTFFNNK
jgi:hypothetical protein